MRIHQLMEDQPLSPSHQLVHHPLQHLHLVSWPNSSCVWLSSEAIVPGSKNSSTMGNIKQFINIMLVRLQSLSRTIGYYTAHLTSNLQTTFISVYSFSSHLSISIHKPIALEGVLLRPAVNSFQLCRILYLVASTLQQLQVGWIVVRG